ncbi:triose-phosphate isomerase [Rhodopseudomonas boonkerdii]|uniref:triose-phosphate isomerase n=1 Tax=Rhodopseudomonas boonkerdii TaxID=475937 RepID=UPI001E2D0642|nr:triose-phosphate isomerase [Rhodopseudomonas boonkerdii]UGV26526.1 triose-phosphate isomerase [Rhodopseudomonas boonkerdii]
MTDAVRPLIAGNWKMNGLKASMSEFEAILRNAPEVLEKADLLVCPPVTLLAAFAAKASSFGQEGRTAVTVGAQDCHPKASGAHTGDVAAEMLADAGATAVIVGHSERRADHGESDAVVREKALAAWRAGLTAIVCIGETQAERDAGKTLDVCGTQLQGSLPDDCTSGNLIVAYEPVWAIGTGLTPTVGDVEQVHKFIREYLNQRFKNEGPSIRILYGGSVKPSNAKELMAVPNVNGALVGGASLKAADFLAIAAGCP